MPEEIASPFVADDQIVVGGMVFGTRQLAAIAFVGITAVGIIATVAYVAGRVINNSVERQVVVVETARPEPTEQAPVAPTNIAAAPTAESAGLAATLVPAPVDPVSPAIPANTVSKVPSQEPQTALLSAGELPVPVSEPAPGESYWQVGVLDRGRAAVAVKSLMTQGIGVKLAVSEALPGQFRLLIGPLTTSEETARLKQMIDNTGFPAFVQHY
jgi:hypothetical protein